MIPDIDKITSNAIMHKTRLLDIKHLDLDYYTIIATLTQDKKYRFGITEEHTPEVTYHLAVETIRKGLGDKTFRSYSKGLYSIISQELRYPLSIEKMIKTDELTVKIYILDKKGTST